MSVSANPTTRSFGHALLVAPPQGRSALVALVSRFGFECAQVDDPYAAMSELCRRPLVYRALIVGLQGLYREELSLISAARQRFPHLDILLTQTENRQAALADALRLGADGLIDADGIHRSGAADAAGGIASSTSSRTTDPRTSAFSSQASGWSSPSTGSSSHPGGSSSPSTGSVPSESESPSQPTGSSSHASDSSSQSTGSSSHASDSPPHASGSSPRGASSPPRATSADPRTLAARIPVGMPEMTEDRDPNEPVLTAEELRALLSDPTTTSSEDSTGDSR